MPSEPKSESKIKIELQQGPIKSLMIPSSWKREDSYSRGQKIKFTQENSKQTSFVILHENRGMSATSIQYYADLLKRREGAALPKALSSKEIKALREFLGSSTIGDNQHSKTHIQSAAHNPAFNLSSAELIEINKVTALEIKGTFVDNGSVPINFSRAIFILCKDTRVLKLFLQTPSQDEFVVSNRIFVDIISSIEWN